MEDIEIINLWNAQNAKIEQSLAINKQLLKETINHKAQFALQSLKRLKTTGIVVTIFYLLFLGYILSFAISRYSPAWNYFLISVSAIFIINVKAFADYIRHLVMVNSINYDGSITEIQQQLSKLQLSIIRHSKIMCLQFPFFTTFYLSSNWFPSEVGFWYLSFQFIMTGAFTYGSYYLYKNHKVENLDKKWLQQLIAGSGGKSVMKAMKFYQEIEEFKQTE